MKRTAQQTLRQVARASSQRSRAFAAPPPPTRPLASTSGRRSFAHAAVARQQQQQQQETKTGTQEETAGESAQDKDKKKKQQQAEENDSTVEGRSPFAAFVEVLREEVRKNREWQDSVKQLGGEVSKVQDSEAMQRAKAMYERARVSPDLSVPLEARII
jgi:import inner membrane translocase subunit TIM44